MQVSDERVLDLWPGRTESEVKGEALREWIAEWPTTPDDGTFLAQIASVRQVMEDGYPSISVRSNEDAADAALAVVRDNQPVKPRRETVRDEIAGHPIGSGYYATTVGVDEAAEIADAVLSLLPGRSEAEVKAESKAEAWDEGAIFGIRNQHGTVDVYIRDAIERHNPYRLAAEARVTEENAVADTTVARIVKRVENTPDRDEKWTTRGAFRKALRANHRDYCDDALNHMCERDDALGAWARSVVK